MRRGRYTWRFDMPISGSRYSWKEENVRNIPEEPGVYALFDCDELIYIGSSHNLKERFGRYWSTGFEGRRCKQATTKYMREITDLFEQREKELLKEYIYSNGGLPRCNGHGGRL